MRTTRWMMALVLMVLCGSGEATAQVSLRVTSYLSHTDNLFQNQDRRSDWIAQTRFHLGYVSTGAWHLYYAGSANVFDEYGDLLTHRHMLGMGYGWARANGDGLYGGVEGSARLDRPVYRHHDYLQADAHLSGRLQLPSSLLLRGGFRSRYRGYLNSGDFSFAEQIGFAQVSRTWQTKTTVRVRGELGAKSFARDASGPVGDLAVRTRADGEGTLVQSVIRCKIAQAVARGTGLQVEYTHRTNLVGSNRYAEVESYTGEDDAFDDRYSYSGKRVEATLKRVGRWGMVLSLTGQYEWRSFEDRPALDLDGWAIGADVTREDRRGSLFLEAEKVFHLKTGWLREVGIHLESLVQDVDSNDPYYATSTRIHSVGFSFGF